MSLGDAAIKLLSTDFVLWQIFVLRSVIAIPVLVGLIKIRSRSASLLPQRPGWVALRSLEVGYWLTLLVALPATTLAADPVA